VIGEQRKLLEDSRGAWVQIKEAGGADPLAQQGTLTHLADLERGIVAEVGVIGDLASDEIDSIGKKAEDKRTDEEKGRVVQLKNLDMYLLEGRARIAEARRKLQDLAAEDAVSRAEAALVALKRAREQLLQPIDALREVAGDQMSLFQETTAVAQADSGTLMGSAAQPSPLIPAWMEPPVLAEREGGLRDRVEEVRARVAPAAEHVDDPQLKPEQKKAITMYKEALPFVAEASAAMDRARTALTGKKLPDAAAAERDALIALAKAIERFADLKQTIDLASETQKQLVTLLSPDSAKQLAPAERGAQARDALEANVARMARIKDLIADELTKVADQEKQVDAAGSGAGSAAQQAEAAKQEVEQQKQLYAQAEKLRGEAEKAIGDLDAAVKANKDPLTPAKAADAKLDELRRLFFNVIEHLQDLVRRQGETRDQTSAAQAEDEIARAPKLPQLEQRQSEHGQLAKAITDKLAEMADAAGKQPQQQPGAPSPKNLAAAADEVRLAQGDMADAKGQLDKAVTTKNQSFSLDPAVKSQAKAVEHLENALRLLQPPKQQDQKQDQQKQDQQKQDQQKQQQQQQQQQQGGAGQRARDMDAQRQRDKQQHEAQGDAVDKDW